MLLAEFQKLGQPRHGAIGIHDFAKDAGGLEPGEPGHVDGGFGVARTAQDAAGFGAQGENVAWLHQIQRHGFGIDEELDGARPVMRADAGGDSGGGIHGNRKVRAIAFPVFQHHALQAELRGAFFGDRRADQARGHAWP